MGFSDNKTAKYPGALGDLKPVMDKLASSVFETSAKTINTGDEAYTVPTSTPYAIRLRYVPKETRDGSGNPIGVAIAGMTEIAWSDTAAPSTAQFMVNYLNGEVKFSAASAGAAVSPAYQGVESRAWAEMLNEALRELKKTQEILGINVQGAYSTAKDRIIATEGEVQTARAGRATLDERLDQIEAALAPMAGASPTRKEPSAETGVLGTAQIELDFDLYADTDTVIAANVKLKDSQNVDYPLTLSYNKTNRRISGTHSALVDEVYTVYTLAGLRDALGRSVTPVSWSYGVGAAVANDTPDVTNLAVLNPNLLGFTAKGTITDLENDTITRVDVRYGTVNNPEDPGNLTVQLTGADIAAFQSVNGKTLNLSMSANSYYCWARAAALLPSGGTQVGDWSTSFGFVVAANARPVVSALQTLASSGTGFTAKGTITDNESDAITQLDIVWSQNGSADPTTLFGGSTKISYTAGADITAFQAAGGKAVSASLAAGDWFWWARAWDAGGAGSWVRIGSAFTVSANTVPTSTITLAASSYSGRLNVAGVISGIGTGDTVNKICVAWMLSGTDADEAAAVAAGRYKNLTAAGDLTAFQGSGIDLYKNEAGALIGLTLDASYIPCVQITENMSGGGTQTGPWARGTAKTFNRANRAEMWFNSALGGPQDYSLAALNTLAAAVDSSKVDITKNRVDSANATMLLKAAPAGFTASKAIELDRPTTTSELHYLYMLTKPNQWKSGYVEFIFNYASPSDKAITTRWDMAFNQADGATLAGEVNISMNGTNVTINNPAGTSILDNFVVGTTYRIRAEFDFDVNTQITFKAYNSAGTLLKTTTVSPTWSATPKFVRDFNPALGYSGVTKVWFGDIKMYGTANEF